VDSDESQDQDRHGHETEEDDEEKGLVLIGYAKRNNRVVYFDSFGNLRPPKELVQYFGNGYDDRIQSHVLSDVRSELLWTNVSAISTNGRRA